MKLVLKQNENYNYELSNQRGGNCSISPCSGEGSDLQALSPMELVAGGLAACILIDIQLILTKQRIDSGDIQINIEAKRVDGVPRPFESIHLDFKVKNDLNKEKLSKNIQLVIDKYCSVRSSLNDDIQISYAINGDTYSVEK